MDSSRDGDGRLLTTAEAAEMLNTPPATLRWWRHCGTGPRSFRLGSRKVMYRAEDVRRFIDVRYEAAGGPAA